MRRIIGQDKLLVLHATGDGFVYNDYAGHGSDASRNNVLHAASCSWILRSSAAVPKYYTTTEAEAVRCLNEHRGFEGIGWRRCGVCHARPTLAPPSHRPSSPGKHSALLDTQPDRARPYLLRVGAGPSRTGEVVEAWSAQRLPYEPRGWLLAYRNELRAALDRLEAALSELLTAVYASAHEAFFDVENVLFYNIGPAFLKGVGRHGIRYERAYQVPPSPQPLPWSAGHYHRYNLGAATGAFENWREGAVIARWHAETHDRADLFDCTRLWFLLKTRGHLTVFQQAGGQPFILRVLITTTPAAAPAATDLLKPISDGIVTVFHRHNGQSETELCSCLATRMTAGPELRVQAVAGQEYYTVQGELLAAEYAGD